jgi:glucose/arabinose dehydrogenase
MRFLRFTATLVAAAALIAPAGASALELQDVGTFDRPTYVTSEPNDPNRLFVVEQAGRIQLIQGGTTTTFLNIEPLVHALEPFGDYGLLSIAFSPHYANNHLFYVLYTNLDGDWQIDEFSTNGVSADPASRRSVLSVKYPLPVNDPLCSPQCHYGGQLQFGPDGYLYASTGDGGPQGDPDGNAQNLQAQLGKILRIDPQGSAPGGYTVPADNPFTHTAGCTDGCDEIWSYGLRNPWRFSFDRLTGDLVIGDVGYASWEEVDFETWPNAGRGHNFGWNCREGAHPGPGAASAVCTARAGTFTDPVFEYPHVDPGPCSVTGGYVVRDRSLADLYGRYLYADFCTGELRSLVLGLATASGDRSEGLSVPRPTSFGEDADCRIYVTSFNGPIYRLTEQAGGATAGCPTSSSEPTPAQEPTTSEPTTPARRLLTLEVEAKRQRLKKKLRVFARASADSTLLVTGKAIKETAKELAGNLKTKIEVKLKREKRQQLQKRLEKQGKARVKIIATATDQKGATATDQIKLNLEG